MTEGTLTPLHMARMIDYFEEVTAIDQRIRNDPTIKYDNYREYMDDNREMTVVPND